MYFYCFLHSSKLNLDLKFDDVVDVVVVDVDIDADVDADADVDVEVDVDDGDLMVLTSILSTDNDILSTICSIFFFFSFASFSLKSS